MKKSIFLLVLAIIIITSSGWAQEIPQADFYVSPYGDDDLADDDAGGDDDDDDDAGCGC